MYCTIVGPVIEDLIVSVFKPDTPEDDSERRTLEAVTATTAPFVLGEGLDHLEVGSHHASK